MNADLQLNQHFTFLQKSILLPHKCPNTSVSLVNSKKKCTMKLICYISFISLGTLGARLLICTFNNSDHFCKKVTTNFDDFKLGTSCCSASLLWHFGKFCKNKTQTMNYLVLSDLIYANNGHIKIIIIFNHEQTSLKFTETEQVRKMLKEMLDTSS